MIAFELYVNDQKVCTAGVDNLDHLNAGIAFIRLSEQQETATTLTLGGYAGEMQKFVRWDHRFLQVGDKVEIRVVETSEVDLPIETITSDEKMEPVKQLWLEKFKRYQTND